MNYLKNVIVISIILIIFICFSGLAGAVQSEFWNLTSRDELKAGTFVNVSLTHKGTLTVSPKLEKLLECDGSIFSIKPFGKKYLLGTANETALVLLDRDGTAVEKMSRPGFSVNGVFVKSADRWYVGNQNEGTVDILTSDGSVEKTIEFDEDYIWVILEDKEDLFIATGNPGRIYRLDKKLNKELYFDSKDNHVVCLALTPSGTLLAGTEGKGILFEIKGKNQASILYDTPLNEISDIVVLSSGDIYFAAVPSVKAISPSFQIPPQMNQPNTPTEESNLQNNQNQNLSQIMNAMAQQSSARPQGTTSSLYFIPKNKSPRVVWQTADAYILALGLGANERLFFGTGEEAALYRFEEPFNATMLHKFEETFIVSIARDQRDDLLIGTGSPGTLYRLKNELAREGEYTSEPFDSTITSQWGHLSFQATVPAQSELALFFHSGNSEHPDDTWTDWTKPITEETGESLDNQIARFGQWKVAMKTSKNHAPEFNALTISYMQENIAPVIESFFVARSGQDPNLSQMNGNQLQNSMNGKRRFFSPTNMRNSSVGFNQNQQQNPSENGTQRLQWVSFDNNNDFLIFKLEISKDGIKNWMEIESDIETRFYDFDTTQLPDGPYTIKLTVSDENDNTSQTAMSTQAFITDFIIDNSPPRITIDSIEQNKETMTITGTIADDYSPISTSYYSLNGDDLIPFSPKDLIFDEKTESFSIELSSLKSGDYFFILESEDGQGNKKRLAEILSVK